MRGHGFAARTSGLRYLRTLLREPTMRVPHATYWVMPSLESTLRNLDWLREQGVPATEDDCYVTPRYPQRSAVEDALRENARRFSTERFHAEVIDILLDVAHGHTTEDLTLAAAP